MTEGFEVLVQLVIAAITTLPSRKESFTEAGTCSSTRWFPEPTAEGLPPSCSHRPTWFTAPATVAAALAADFGLTSDGRAARNDSPACESATRSCGRFGPARLGSTVERSSASNSE